jgi:uncharacterized repeat protein (TIGR02543 family)
MKSRIQLAGTAIALLSMALSARSATVTVSAPYGPPTTANTWQQFTIPLTAAAFGTDAATFTDIMSSVTRFRIRTEMRDGTDAGNLDDVAIGGLYSATFDSGPDGWSASGDGTLAWIATGGHSGGYVRISDWASGDWHYGLAPDTWLGDWSAISGTSISFWFMTNYPDYAAVVEISGGGSVQQLSLVSSAYSVRPERTALMTVGISQGRTVATSVTLSSSSTSAFTVPASVTIPAGERTITFEATAGATAGTSSTITATASGYASSRVTLQVVDAVWQLVFHAGSGGTLSSGSESGKMSVSQTVTDGQSSAAVTAVPTTGYVFSGWTRSGGTYSALNPLTVANVTADLTLAALFEPALFTLTYLAGEHGSVGEPALQTVRYGSDGIAVLAEAADAFYFVRWSDGRTDNPRLDADVAADLTVTALFEACDTSPDSLAFATQEGVARSTWVVSNHVLVTGVSCTVPLAVTGGEYSLDSGPWTTVPGTVNNGQEIRLRQTSAPEWATSTQCLVDLGDGSAMWTVTTESCRRHAADQNADGIIQLSPELTRLIQFYNHRGYHCQAGSEDGYAPGPAGAASDDTACGPHQADQNGDWEIELSPDLTRLIQFYNSGGYHCATGTEDGYAPTVGARKAVAKPGTLSASRSVRPSLTSDGALEVSVALSHSQPLALTSLLVQESLPPGWKFVALQGLQTPAIKPRPGDGGVLSFAWVSMPAEWPVRLTYRIIPGGATRSTVQSIRGHALWREAAGEKGGDIPTAAISPTTPIPAVGQFAGCVDAADVSSGRGLWDLSGTYAAIVAGRPLLLNLVHESTGKLSGLATYTVADGTAVAMPIRGAVDGTAGSIALAGTLKGADPARVIAVSLALNLTVDTANRRLTGPLTGSVRNHGTTTPIREDLALPIPLPMDGSWTLRLQLAQAGATVTGTALLTLSNGVGYALRVQGKAAGASAVLGLSGAPAEPLARALRCSTTITPLTGGSARLERLSFKGYGQTVEW